MSSRKTGSRLGSPELLILAIVGIALAVYPGAALRTAAKILGLGVLIYGVICVIQYIARQGQERSFLFLIRGLITAAAGIILVITPELLIDLFPVCAGIVIISGALLRIWNCLQLKKIGDTRWSTMLVLSLLDLAFGVLILSDPFQAAATLVRLAGVMLAFHGILGFVIGWRLR